MIHDLDISGIQMCVVLLDSESRPAEVSAQGGRNTELDRWRECGCNYIWKQMTSYRNEEFDTMGVPILFLLLKNMSIFLF